MISLPGTDGQKPLQVSEVLISNISALMRKYFYFIFFFWLFKAALVAYGGSQARGLIGATAAGLHHSRSNSRSKPRLQPTPQLTAMLYP